MTVLLVLALLVAALTIDALLARPDRQTDAAPELRPAAPPPVVSPLATVVGGFRMQDGFRYHPGHTWAVAETPELARVGIDDFAARLAGSLDRITLPERGQWIRQGQRIVGVDGAGGAWSLVSPIEGVVVDVNEEALVNPNSVRTDPYGEGWLMKVSAPELRTNLRNLLHGSVARRWMEDAAERIRQLAGVPSAAMAQDGGVVVDDPASVLDESARRRLGAEFFLQ